MDHFYRLLAQGLSKDVALQKAKINYLENADQLTAHPFFWAGMVLSGEATPIKSNSTFSSWQYAALIFLGIAFYFLFRIKRKSNKVLNFKANCLLKATCIVKRSRNYYIIPK